MTENKFGWKAGDALVWSSPEGCDKSCVVTKATAMMIEFETEDGETKRVKGNNPSIARIDDSPPRTEPMTVPEMVTVPEPELEPESKLDMVPETEPEPSEVTDAGPKPEKPGDCAPISSGAEERISECRAEVDLNLGGIVMASVQIREGGSGLLAGEQEFRLNGAGGGEGEWHPSLEEALDAKYGRSWMCIRMQER